METFRISFKYSQFCKSFFIEKTRYQHNFTTTAPACQPLFFCLTCLKTKIQKSFIRSGLAQSRIPAFILVTVQSCPPPGRFGSHLSWCALALPWNNYCKYSFILLFLKLYCCHVKLEKLVQIYLYLYIRFIQDSLNQYSRLSLLSPDCFDFFLLYFYYYFDICITLRASTSFDLNRNYSFIRPA